MIETGRYTGSVRVSIDRRVERDGTLRHVSIHIDSPRLGFGGWVDPSISLCLISLPFSSLFALTWRKWTSLNTSMGIALTQRKVVLIMVLDHLIPGLFMHHSISEDISKSDQSSLEFLSPLTTKCQTFTCLLRPPLFPFFTSFFPRNFSWLSSFPPTITLPSEK